MKAKEIKIAPILFPVNGDSIDDLFSFTTKIVETSHQNEIAQSQITKMIGDARMDEVPMDIKRTTEVDKLKAYFLRIRTSSR